MKFRFQMFDGGTLQVRRMLKLLRGGAFVRLKEVSNIILLGIGHFAALLAWHAG